MQCTQQNYGIASRPFNGFPYNNYFHLGLVFLGSPCIKLFGGGGGGGGGGHESSGLSLKTLSLKNCDWI